VLKRLSPVTRIAFIALVTVHAALFVSLLAQGDPIRGDFARYWQIGSAAGRPYRDFPVEYPPLTTVIFRTLAAPHAAQPFAYGVLALNAASDAVLIAALGSGWGAAAAIFYMAGILPILPVLYFRFDLWPMAAAILGVWMWQRQRPAAGAAAFAAGFGLKLWPVVLSLWMLGERRGARRRQAVTALIVGCAAILLIWVAMVGGLAGMLQVITFRDAKGWSIESVIGSVVHLGDRAVRVESGAWRVGMIPPFASIVLFAVSAPLSLAAVYQGMVTQRLGASWIAAIGILLLGSALISPQFFAWLLPGAAIAWTHRDRAPALTVVITVMLSTAVLAVYRRLVEGDLAAEQLVIVRNAACFAAVLLAARSLATPRSERVIVVPDERS
jgi:hypothetical protein